jgi:1,4-dihydroxy-6-naphthoate synthase
MTREIKVAHSPDSDDAFMFYALATDKLDTGDIQFTHVLRDIQTLNQIAMTTREYDVTAVSFHAYAYLAEHYVLLPHGASIGDGYGPIVVARDPFPASELSRKRIAVPGTLTSAYLALRLHTPEFEYGVVPFDEIIEAVVDGSYDAGLLIHEGQLTPTHKHAGSNPQHLRTSQHQCNKNQGAHSETATKKWSHQN